jgi:glycolate oxidase iron-sulfur subunit
VSGFAGLATCVHCGFCLQSCPTYLVTGDEADSPRGRIVLMRRMVDGALAPDDHSLQHHLDRCLGCRACEPVCPSGVAYGGALEAARERITTRRPLAAPARLLLVVVATPWLRGIVFGVARWLRPLARALAGWSRPRFAMGMMAGTRPWMEGWRDGVIEGWKDSVRADRDFDVSIPPSLHPSISRRVIVFAGCVQHELFSHVNAAAARTLSANGYALVEAPEQGCCGALHAHAGDLEGARALARANVRAFAETPEAQVAATAAGCGAMLRDYGTLLADDPLAEQARALADRVRDVTELLAAAGPRAGAPLRVRVAYDAPCHLLHAQRVDAAPLTVLAAVPGIEVVPHTEAEVCCGSAGIYSLLQPSLSRALLRRKLEALAAAAPDVVVTGNPGCAMQIAAGLAASGATAAVAHPVEILDASYARAGYYRRDRLDSPSHA